MSIDPRTDPLPAAASILDERRVLDQLREREAQLREAQAIAGLGSWEWDVATDRVTWSEELFRIYGLDPASFTATYAAYLERIHPDDRAHVEETIGRAFASGHTFDFEERIVRPDGEVRLLHSRGHVVRDGSGAPVRFVGTCLDITAQRQVDEALRRANEELEQRVAERTAELAAANRALEAEIAEHQSARQALLERTTELEALFQALPDLYFRVDRDGTVLDYRAGRSDSLLVSPEVFLGKRLADTLPPPVAAQTHAALEALARTRALQTFEYSLPLPDGLREFEARLAPFGDEQAVIVVRDITERKQAEAELIRQKAYFEEILGSMDSGIAVFDREFRYEYVSSKAIPDPEMRRWVVGRTIPEYCRERGLPTEIGVERQRSLEEGLATGQPNHFEQEVRQPDGTAGHMLRRLVPVVDGEGRVVRLIGYSIDITDRKHAEIALQQAKEEADQAREAAERANRAKSEFLSRMSHELRTPMNSILGFAQLLERGSGLAPTQVKSLQHILKAGRHLLQLINEVLEISRIEAGRHTLSLEPVRVGTVLQEAVGLLRPLAAQHGVELDEGPWHFGDTWVRADRQRLTQVMLNLLSNAIKYNRAGGRVRLSCAPPPAGDGPAPRVCVRVEDTGHGIPAERIHELFTPFARFSDRQAEVEGTGLGLALSQRLAEAMGGTLRLERTDAGGSVFRVELQPAGNPLQRLDESDVADRPTLDGRPHAAATLLYVEDNLANLTLVETILLSRPHWRTVPALQGQLGVELAREHRPDLVLLDLHLPDISGEEVLRRLRADARTARIPVAIISADATPTTIERLRAQGADAFLTKPLDIDEFLDTIERLLPAAAE